MRAIFSELARREFDDTEGLGGHFRGAVMQALGRIIRYPHGWSTERGDVRRCAVQRFPYKLPYSVEVDHIFVIAVAHQHRKPEYWVDR